MVSPGTGTNKKAFVRPEFLPSICVFQVEGWIFETKEPNRIPHGARFSISLRRGVGHTRASTAPGIVAASGGQIVPAFDGPQETAKNSD